MPSEFEESTIELFHGTVDFISPSTSEGDIRFREIILFQFFSQNYNTLKSLSTN